MPPLSHYVTPGPVGLTCGLDRKEHVTCDVPCFCHASLLCWTSPDSGCKVHEVIKVVPTACLNRELEPMFSESAPTVLSKELRTELCSLVEYRMYVVAMVWDYFPIQN